MIKVVFNTIYRSLTFLGRLISFPFVYGYKILRNGFAFLMVGVKIFHKKTSSFDFSRLNKKLSKPLTWIFSILRNTFWKLGVYTKAFFSLILSIPARIARKIYRAFFKSRIYLFFVGIIFSFLFIFSPYILYEMYNTLPDPGILIEKGNRRSTKILDRNGVLLYEIYDDRRYDPVKLDQIPPHTINATLAIEDDKFYDHHGFRLESMLRAAKIYLTKGEVQGASTITQQLVKNVLLSPERTIDRKIRELVLSVMVERRYSKDELLELYLNNISYGGTAWGVESAAQKFFGKFVWELSLAESAMLAGLPSAPSVYSPLNSNIDTAKRRQKQVLDRMVGLGYINVEESKIAYTEELIFVPQTNIIRAPHFVFYVRDILEKKYGSRAVMYGGLTIRTSLDLALQEKVQELVREGVANNSYLNLTNGASVVLDAPSSEILAYVGSVDFFQEGWGAYDVSNAGRQPGSSVKPITYSLALSKGFTPASVINDSPVSYSQGVGLPPYRPVNYDGRFRGNVTLRQALAGSYNIPAVKVANSLGPKNIVGLGNKMGMKSWDPESDYGLAVTLGSKEARLIELTNTFGTLARGGNYIPTEPFLSIKDSNGRELYNRVFSAEAVVDPGVAFLISSILSDNSARASAFGFNSPLNIPGKVVAVKTGTTDNKRDNWTVGYTPSFVVGVWVGNNDNTAMNQFLASGLTGAAPIWNNIMSHLLADIPREEFVVPDNIFLKVDSECERREYFLKGSNVPASLCPPKKEKDKDKEE